MRSGDQEERRRSRSREDRDEEKEAKEKRKFSQAQNRMVGNSTNFGPEWYAEIDFRVVLVERNLILITLT